MKYKAKHYYQNKDVAERYFGKRFKSLSGKLNHFIEKSFLKSAINQIEIKSALDVACGTGRLTKELLSFNIESVTGVDISKEMLSTAKEFCNNQANKARFEVSDATDLSFNKNEFDLVVSFRFLDHLPVEKKKDVICELGRCSKKHIVFTMANINKMTSFARKIRKYFNKNYYEGYLVDESEILLFLDSINMKVIKQKLKFPFLSMETMYFCEV
ncbi:MAG: class I SAM-dependent methyltransferase [Candidatus Marinimicrobia bacterium]|nr:class I SAM-dependent methyltransferase [Candidatus Neomarinimicrobiota bacterium]MBL7109678.1 class I SAM-dependent methyltransferase [Candidatus Neomarinimicrobiota bacterium]